MIEGQVAGEEEKREDQGTCPALSVYSWQVREPALISYQKMCVAMQEKGWYNTHAT